MAEDIDIEEHDLLQNPIIKRIFPDLSVLKQEIMDFDEDWPEKAGHSEFMNTGNVLATSTTNVACNFHTKIVLGSKPSKATKKLKNDVKVILHNITPSLTKTRFCDICLILFPNTGSLNAHKLSVHKAINYSSNKDFPICPQQNISTVKTYNHQTKLCFHCNKLFSDQQDLIDHLYTILYAKNEQVSLDNVKEKEAPPIKKPKDKKNVFLQKNICVNSDKQIKKERKVSKSKNIYSCPICSYYFNDEIFCRKHVIVKHKAIKDMQIYKSSFNPMCKFCDVKLLNILSYNTHLRKNHEIEMLNQVNGVLSSDNIGIRQCYRNLPLPGNSTVDIYSKKLAELVHTFKSHDPIFDNIQVVVSKIILFQCSECDIHFLTSDAAFKHFVHLRFHETWECTKCHRLFKGKDAITHQKQHKYSNYFRVIKVFAEIQSRILYRCSICAVYFGKDFFSEHCCTCESEQSRSESSYCKICDIIIGSSTKLNHENDHNVKKFTRIDFQIIVSESPFLNKDYKSYNKNCGHDQQKQVKPYLPESMILDLKKPANNMNKKRKCNNVVKISKSLFAKKHLTYNYCNICKCNICRVYKTDVHLNSLCVNIVKYICKYCGLMFSNKSITSHRRLHHNCKSLKLQDFTFYNLQTNKVMIPLIPEYPKCELCEKHFISKVEVKGHLCDTNDYLKCSICKSKFSETAYKLHMPFHSYNLKTKQQPNELINKINSYSCPTENIKNYLSMDDTIPIIYTCKNCNLSINAYDEVIEHCHLHTNLNKVEVNGVECVTCQLKFANSSYNKHIELHKDFENVHFTHIYFDVVYFGSDKWLKHIFKTLPKHKVDVLIRDSIYKHETRIKMAVIQEGPSNLDIYKCEKCQCIIDSYSIYSHIETCCPHSEISNCTFCDLSFACSITRNNHEKLHASSDITIKSYRIVMFNREQDRNINYNISNIKKWYVVYECRYCHVLVENYNYIYHICFRNDTKKCYICGLLVCAENINAHILKHKLVPSFNKNRIKVVLLGNQIEENNILQSNKELIPTFSGIVCDYTFYKCIDCEVCVRDVRNTVQHSCLIDAAKSQCIKCDLIFDEGKLKGHLKLHDTDPDFTRETILVKPFTNRKPNRNDNKHKMLFATETEKRGKNNNEDIKHVTSFKTITNQTQVNFKTAKLYKCSCGLHFIQQSSLQEHIKRCSGKNKNIQNCSKCCLTFTSDVLFKHLLEHHGDKNVVFKYEIIKNSS